LLLYEDTMIDKLYELVGGRRTISAATERFYSKVLADDSLSHFFSGTDMNHLRSRQVMFVSMLLGAAEYRGKDIRSAHGLARSQGLSDAHFDSFLKHFRVALAEVGVKSENVEQVMKLVENNRRTVLDQ
jgi:hemoglobin